MKQMYPKQKMLNWLDSEKKKDFKELEIQKSIFANELKQMNKKDFFPEKKQLTLWQKFKRVILGI